MSNCRICCEHVFVALSLFQQLITRETLETNQLRNPNSIKPKLPAATFRSLHKADFDRPRDTIWGAPFRCVWLWAEWPGGKALPACKRARRRRVLKTRPTSSGDILWGSLQNAVPQCGRRSITTRPTSTQQEIYSGECSSPMWTPINAQMNRAMRDKATTSRNCKGLHRHLWLKQLAILLAIGSFDSFQQVPMPACTCSEKDPA